MYEIVPSDADTAKSGGQDLKYQETRVKPAAGTSHEMMTVKLRYKPVGKDQSRLIERVVPLFAP